MNDNTILDWNIAQDDFCQDELISLYRTSFADSINDDEGNMVADLVANILQGDKKDWRCDVTVGVGNEQKLLGATLWTRLFYDDVTAFLLSPVAVATDYQGQGIAQDLISHGLATLKQNHVALAFTYGDPNFYDKVGFLPIDLQRLPPPYPLSQPFGWIGQMLNGDDFTSLVLNPPTCVPAFCNPNIW